MLNPHWLIVPLAALASAGLVQAQNPSGESSKVADQKRAVESRLEQVIPTTAFSDAMPLAKFLAIVEKQLPAKYAIALRIDMQALGDRYDEVAGTVIKMPPYPKKMALLFVMRLAMSQINTPTDFRIGAGEFVITTPEDAKYVGTHDFSKAISRPRLLDIPGIVLSGYEPKSKERIPDKFDVARIVEMIVADVNLPAEQGRDFDKTTIQVLNRNRLVVRTNASNHWQIAGVVAALQRLGDLAVIVRSKLYEVDDVFFDKLKNAKPVDWEEAERRFLEGKLSKRDSLLDLLTKQKPVQEGDDVRLEDGSTALLVARQHAWTRARNGNQVAPTFGLVSQSPRSISGSPVVLQGVSFTTRIYVTPDRRAVRMQLTEKATEIRQVKKVKVMVTNDGKEVDVDIPFTNETTHLREFEIPDGGAMLIPVHYRPKALQDKNRWWVLHIQPRIWIEEEEKLFREQALGEITPLVVADIVKNPRLKATCDFSGTPGDKRFALIDSAAWAWPKEFKADVSDFERAPAKRAGRRLLGIRVDQFQQADKEGDNSVLTVTLVNAGGSDNGAVIGGCTIHYTAQSTANGWVVELTEK